MGQDEIVGVLRARPEKWFTSTELAKITRCDRDNVNRTMRSMRKFKEVHWTQMCNGMRCRTYHYKYKE